MKFHLPLGLLKVLLAVVCLPATTIAADAVPNAYTQPIFYTGSGLALAANTNPLYWDSVADESAVWDTVNTLAWVDENSVKTPYAAGSQAVFGEGADLNKSVEIAPEGMSASTVEISGSGYQFSGGDMVVTERVSAEKSATMDNVLVIGSSSTPLEIQVAGDEQLTIRVLETAFTGSHEHHIYAQGSFVKSGEGTLSITEAVHGAITGATVTGGKLELGSAVSLDVGANEIKGGTLENVEMLISGEINRPVSGEVATAHNVITSADGVNPAVLTNVTLHAGTTTEYATLQNVSFAGASTLRGYITFEKTQRQHDMSVAAGGSLTVDNVCFDLHGLSSGEKVLIVNNAVDSTSGTLTGWNTVKFVYSGITVNRAAVDTSVAGVVTINREHSGNLYWNGTEDAKWGSGDANWSTQPDGSGSEAFTSLSNVYFGADAANRDITVVQDLVVMDFNLSGGDYSFSGGRIATLGDATVNTGTEDTVTFHDLLVVQGNMTTSGQGTLELLGATTVVKDLTLGTDHINVGADLTVLGKFSVNAGSAIDAGSLTLSGNVTAQEMNIAVSAGEKVGNSYNEPLVNVSGDLSVGKSGKITIGGTAEQHYLGVVRAGDLTVNTQEHDVYFDHLHVGSLTVGAGAAVHVQTATAAVGISSSEFPVINLSGTLALDAHGVTYDRGYEVNVLDDAAALSFGTDCTIANLSIYGKVDESGYKNLSIASRSRSATVEHMENLRNLSFSSGSVTVKNSTHAVHGELSLNNSKLNLGEGSDDFMAEDSKNIVLTKASVLNIGSTTQHISAGNIISLSSASSITGAADSSALVFADGAAITYDKGDNSIIANMVAANMVVDHMLNIHSEQANSSLDISGKLSGEGTVQLSGAGTVALTGVNLFTGMVTVGEGSTLSLQNAAALADAGVVLNNGGTLSLDTDTAVYLDALTFNNGATLSFSTITDTDGFSADHAALHVTKDAAVGSGTLNISFAEELDTLRTYNLLTGLSSLDGITLNVQHKGSVLHDSQYKVYLDAESGLLYMQILMGNVWEGQGQSKIWSTANTDGNWCDHSNYNENTDHKAAIFDDLNGDSETVYVQGTVNPGDVYFVAGKTNYTLLADTDGLLTEGTVIHKKGDATVQLSLTNNATADTALGDIDVQDGTLEFLASAAVGGTVTVASEGCLAVDDELKMAPNADGEFNYTLSAIVSGTSATLSGVTMDASGIRGASAESYGSADRLLVLGSANLAYLTLTDFEAEGNVTLSNVTLASSAGATSHLLKDVTIGTGVAVDASGDYTISGDVVFDGTLNNEGKVTLKDITHVEIGKIAYTPVVDKTFGSAEYVYQLVNSVGNGNLTAQIFTADRVSINGVNLANDLASGIGAVFTDNKNGSFTLSVGKILAYDDKGNITQVDGSVGMPQWDERWGKTENAPGISRRYVGTEVDNVGLADGNGDSTGYYKYGSIVNTDTASKVNNGKAIVVTLSSDASGEFIAGSRNGGNNNVFALDHEVWIEDCSAFKHVIGGMDDYMASWAGFTQTAATHILVNSTAKRDPDSGARNDIDYIRNRENWAKQFIIGGTRWGNQTAESYVTVLQGEIYTIFGGSCGGFYLVDPDASWYSMCPSSQTGTSHVFVDGGRIGEIFAAGMYSTLTGTQEVDGRTRASELVITGGTLGGYHLRVFGGGERGEVHGDIYVRMEGNAEIKSRLVGGSNVGKVYGNITMDLISGSAFRVDAAGLGWKYYDYVAQKEVIEEAYIKGEVQVNLYSAFQLGKGEDLGLQAGIYGGRELTNYVSEDCTSILHFAESSTTYELGFIGEDGYTASEDSIVVTGFDRFELEEDAHAVLSLGYFDIDMDPTRTLIVSGKGVVEVIGHGANFGRNIELTDGATLKVSTSVIGLPDDDSDDRTIYVTKGTTLDLTGYPVESGYVASDPYAGLSFVTEVCGDGVDGRGAIFKGTVHEADDDKLLSASMVSLPKVTLTGNTSVGVMNHEVLHMSNYEQREITLDLKGYTFTKQGLGSFVARNVTMSEGTILVHQGDFYIDKGSLSRETDIVMAAGTSLHMNSVNSENAEEGSSSPAIRSLSGSGSVILNDAVLTLHTTRDSAYRDNYMDNTQSYNQFLDTTGFGYAVFSGTISEGSDASSLVKAGDGVHYLSGSANTYSGGTRIEDGRLYLLGTSTQSGFVKGGADVAFGVAGTGAIIWAGENAELYLGHDTRIYNEGTVNEAGGVMTIGVEGAPNGVLADFVGIHSKGNNPLKMNGVEYVEIETHNLKSIAVDATYADGTEYVAGTDIDHNKMLLVKMSEWETARNTEVTGFSDAGYNEAIYSGVLFDSNDVAARLHKVGVGTLVLDQSNSYTGGTEIEAGTLRVRGWGSLGKNAKENAVNVQEGATLMFTHNSGYGNEPTSAANNITIAGSGDARWLGHAATDGDTAALISAVGPAVTFTLSGDIDGSGNVRHSGEGVLVLNGDNTYTGGTYASRGTVEVQSADGLGATACGVGTVTIESDADLRVTVEEGYTGKSLVTSLAADVNDIQGDVSIRGTADTERILHMDGNGYNALSSTLKDNGTLLLNGAAIDGTAVKAESALLTGSGKVVVSDASGSGASATFDSMIDYSGDFRVEGDNASISVKTGTYIDGSIHVAGKHASVNTGSHIYITDANSLSLSSLGDATQNTAAVVKTDGAVNIEAGAVFSVQNKETSYAYDLSGLQNSVAFTLEEAVQSSIQSDNLLEVRSYQTVGSAAVAYDGRFDAANAVNLQAVGAVQAKGGLTLDGGSTYETSKGHTSLMGGSLTLDTMENSLLTFHTTPDVQYDASTGEAQLVLFSGVNRVYFVHDMVDASSDSGSIYYTMASRYLTGSEFIDDNTVLVYDSREGVVYLQQVVPEPATATLSLLALAALAARRRRK